MGVQVHDGKSLPHETEVLQFHLTVLCNEWSHDLKTSKIIYKIVVDFNTEIVTILTNKQNHN